MAEGGIIHLILLKRVKSDVLRADLFCGEVVAVVFGGSNGCGVGIDGVEVFFEIGGDVDFP